MFSALCRPFFAVLSFPLSVSCLASLSSSFFENYRDLAETLVNCLFCLFVRLCVCLLVCLFVCFFVCLFVVCACLCLGLFACLFACFLVLSFGCLLLCVSSVCLVACLFACLLCLCSEVVPSWTQAGPFASAS